MNQQHTHLGTVASQKVIYTPPKGLQAIVDSFPVVARIEVEGSLPQDTPRLLNYNLFDTYRNRQIFPQTPDWANQEHRAMDYAKVNDQISSLFRRMHNSTSRANLITLVEGLNDLFKETEDEYNINFFQDFGSKLSFSLHREMIRAVREATEIAGRRMGRVTNRDLTLANKMSDIYHFAALFGAAPFPETFPAEFDALQRSYIKRVKADVRETSQSGQGNAQAFIANGVIAGRFTFGDIPDFDTLAMFRGANYGRGTKAVYRRNI